MENKKKTRILTSVGEKRSKSNPRELEVTLKLLRLHPEPDLSDIPLERNFFYQIKQTKNERIYS